MPLLQLISVALGSGLTVKVLDIAYSEIRRRADHSRTAKRFVDEHLDPLLKSADELVGKLHALGREDFQRLRNLETAEINENTELSSLVYLFARFWANVEIIRTEGLAIAISEDTRGRQLQNFLDCMESQHVRLIDRANQRAIGETCLARENSHLRIISYTEFVRLASTDSEVSRWLGSLLEVIRHGWHTEKKQKLLLFGAVAHAMIDTLDGDHAVTKKRPAIPNKLTYRTWKNLRYMVFGVYLKFVRDQEKYLGPPKSKGPKGKVVRKNS